LVNEKVKIGYKNMSSLTQEQLNKSLWAGADDMRKSMSADDYKDYLLGLVFFKNLSDVDFSHYFRWLFANFRECSLIS